MLPFQIDLLQQLVGQAPVYQLDLGPDVPALPGLLEGLLRASPTGPESH
jgi:hypothetical protein